MSLKKFADLTSEQCILIAVQLASTTKLNNLRKVITIRPDIFNTEFTLRILLSYLPENLEPTQYVKLIASLATQDALKRYTDDNQDIVQELLNTEAKTVAELSPKQARKRVKRLYIIPLEQQRSIEVANGSEDLITRFLIQRVHRIEAETGLLDLVPGLIVPFIDRSEYLKTWFISSVLPLLRLNYEYYPLSSVQTTVAEDASPTTAGFENMGEAQAVDLLLSRSLSEESGSREIKEGNLIGRDLRCLVGPWVYGEGQRKRRKIWRSHTRPTSNIKHELAVQDAEEGSDQFTQREKRSDWNYAFKWLIMLAKTDLPAVFEAVREWNGPEDVDLGEYAASKLYTQKNKLQLLRQKYIEVSLASICMATSTSKDTVACAHGLLMRVTTMLDYDPVPGLSADIRNLPSAQGENVEELVISPVDLQAETLLAMESSLNVAKKHVITFLVNIIFSANIFTLLNHAMSIRGAVALHSFAAEKEQLSVLQQVLQSLAQGKQRTADEWDDVRAYVTWLWSWNSIKYGREQYHGGGVLGKISREELGIQILKILLSVSCYSIAIKRFVEQSDERRLLPSNIVEAEVLDVAMHLYDNSSNGNRTRGNMKKVSDLLVAFRPYYRGSPAFQRCEALLAATHALSFYALTMQHGVPFQPVNIRVSKDPLLLVQRVLEQNPRSYTKLEDLVEISNNLVGASLGNHGWPKEEESSTDKPTSLSTDLEWQKAIARRRITVMAVEAALAEDDFETAYSYVVNHLTAPLTRSPLDGENNKAQNPDTQSTKDENDDYVDDISWRAAFAAGKYKPKSTHTYYKHSNSFSAATTATGISFTSLRHLNQRMDLLSQALILAPPPSLAELLAVWRRCEEELLAAMAEAEGVEGVKELNSNSNTTSITNSTSTLGSILPNTFGNDGKAHAKPKSKPKNKSQNRNSRVYGDLEGDNETPVGLLDVARGAAAAFSRTGLLSLPSASAVPTLSSTGGGVANRARPTSTASSSMLSEGTGRAGGNQDKAATGIVGEATDFGGEDFDAWNNEDDEDDEDDGTDANEDGNDGDDDDDATRIRKRDIVASKVTEGLASGIGWVLGAKPVSQQE